MTDLRDQIAEALTQWTLNAAAGGRSLHPPHQAALRENSLARADAVMGVVQPELDRLEAENARLRLAFESARAGRHTARLLANRTDQALRRVTDERDAMNEALREAELDYPLGPRGVADLAMQRDGHIARAEEAEAERDEARRQAEEVEREARDLEDTLAEVQANNLDLRDRLGPLAEQRQQIGP